MSGGVIVEPQGQHRGGSSDWIVPRRVMCAFFWVGIILLFTGIILLVTSKHKEEFYQSWGAILLGLGFCLLLICFILCMHAYCVITVSDEDGPSGQTPRQTQTQKRPQDLIRKKAPLKQPPTFKIPSSPGANSQVDGIDKKKPPFGPARLKSISENGSPRHSLARSDSGNYGSTALRADHVRTCLANKEVASLPPSLRSSRGDGLQGGDVVHYVASPPLVKISMSKRSTAIPEKISPNKVNNRVLINNDNILFNSKSSLDKNFADDDSSNKDSNSAPISRNSSKSRENISSYLPPKTTSSHIIVQNTPVQQDYHFEVSPLSDHKPCDQQQEYQQQQQQQQQPNTEDKRPECSCSREDLSQEDCFAEVSEPCTPDTRRKTRYSATAATKPYFEEDLIQPEHKLPVHTKTVQETNVYSRPIVTARVTQLPGNRSSQRYIPNGAPPQLAYNRQYPISAVHAYPIRYRHPHPLYSPLRVQVDDDSTESGAEMLNSGVPPNNRLLRPALTPIPEQHQQQQQQDDENFPRDFSDATNHPFSRGGGIHGYGRQRGEGSNLVNMQGMMERGLSSSANIFLNPDQSESKMSIYDNLNYIRI